MSSKERNNFYIRIDTLQRCVTIKHVSTNKTIAFYQELYKFITAPKFSEVQAAWLAGQVKSIDPSLSCDNLGDVDYLHAVYNECQDLEAESDIINQIAEWAFTDLAPFMAEYSSFTKSACRIFHDITNLSGTNGDEDLYAHILESTVIEANGEKGCGLTRVTLMVSSLEGLIDLLKNPKDSMVETGHFSQPKSEVQE